MRKGYLNGIPFLFSAAWGKPQFEKRWGKISSSPTRFLRFPSAKPTFSNRETYISATGNVRFRAGKPRKEIKISGKTSAAF